ncbi:MAG TPA: transcription-repair coupling factor [Acidimicrobiales bacterium]|nr:transcription-repair coupling factor [Acidimicrobiales bacterium]
MSLRSLPSLLRDDPVVASVLGQSSAVLAVPEPARAYVVAGLATLSNRHPYVVAVPTTTDADRLALDLRAYLGDDQVDVFPAWETLPFERVSPSVETMGRRCRVMWRLREPGRMPRVLVAPIRALVQRLGPHVEDVDPVTIRPGDTLDPDDLVRRLVAAGYRREYQVEHRGEVAVRGSIVDVFPSTADVPVRVDLWGDEVDRLTEFAVADQRATVDVACAEIFPCRELLPTDEVRARAERLIGEEPWGREQWERLAEGQTFEGMESWLPWLVEGEHVLLDLVGADAQVVLVEPRRMRDRAKELLDEEASLADTLALTWGAVATHDGAAGSPDAPDATDATGATDLAAPRLPAFPRLHLPFDRLLAHTDAPAWTIASAAEGPGTSVVEAHGWDPVFGDSERLITRLADLARNRFRVNICAEGRGTGARITQSLTEGGLDVPFDENSTLEPEALTLPGLRVIVQPLERGFVLPSIRLAVLAESDVTGRRRAHRRARPRRASEGFFEDLKPGDYVVHYQHGVAKYGGMVKRAIGGVERDYLLLEYRGGDKLYVPSDQIDAVRHYTGGESPSLNKLGGSDWQKTKSRVRAEVRRIAQELVVLYRKRVTSPGHAFGPDTPWQHELEESFPYVETPDQVKAITDVKADMEEPRPMDRLVCGDVGFGKTEVALRAVFKAVQDGKQAAILVPTTLLAQQHFQTFSERFAGYPIRVEVLSRFLTPGQAKKVIEGLGDGSVDVIVGTHRLLSADVKFKDLGLLVVDEEQRFGVTHKEQIKQLRTNVDVLTLTATPIPRTLEMSLTGIRDLTLLNTPPAERQPILTYVGEYDERAVGEAVRRELLREGQVFFVHNRVMDIEHVAARLRELVPEARVAIAHGQMDEGTLEKVVIDFWEGEYDVLVCTTIIESGIDMPTVNTLVVDRADLMGLGQLHQLRGRVGRAGQRAYAYLFVPPDRMLSEEAYERLKTIGEHTELGSGYKIAMRDLEIRGAGNLLGETQSGHIAAVGYDLYVQMVSEAVAELKGEELREPAEIKLDIPLAANLPPSYVEKEELRLEAYRRLAAVTTAQEVDDIEAEWLDRYGPIPDPARALLDVGHLRAECSRIGVREVAVARDVARMSPVDLKASQAIRLKRLFPKAVYKEDLAQVVAPIPRGQQPATYLRDLLAQVVPEEVPSVAS